MLTKLLERRSRGVVRENSVPMEEHYDHRRNGERNRENSKASYKPRIIGSNGSVSAVAKHSQNCVFTPSVCVDAGPIVPHCDSVQLDVFSN